MSNSLLVTRTCQCLFSLVIAFCVYFGLTQSLQLNTDLKSLSPNLIDNQEVQSAIHTLSKSIEGRFSIAITGEDIDDIEEASEIFSDLTQTTATQFALADPLDHLETLLPLYQKHQFQLLTSEQYQEFSKGEPSEIKNRAIRQLYSLESQANVFPIEIDPLGHLNHYIFSSLSTDTENEDDKNYIILQFIVEGDALDMEVQAKLLSELAVIQGEVNREYPTIKLLRSGVVFFASEAAQSAKRDISFISTVSSIGIFLLLLFAFRAFGPLMLPGLSIFSGITFALCLSNFLSGSVHIITVVFGAGLIGVVIDYALHFVYHQTDNRIVLFKALFFSLCTSAIGYAALTFSNLKALQDVALFSIVGLIGAWLCVMAVGPSIAKSFSNTGYAFVQSLNSMLIFIQRHRRTLLLISCTLVLASAVHLVFKIKFSDNPRVFFSASPHLMDEELAFQKLGEGYEPGNYLIIGDQFESNIYQHFEALDKLMDDQSALLHAGRWVPSPKQQKNNYRSLKRHYEQNGTADIVLSELDASPKLHSALFSRYNEANNFELKPSAFINAVSNMPSIWQTGNTNFAFVLIPKGTSTLKLEQYAEQNSDVTFINTALMSEQTLKQQRESALKLLLLAIAFIALLVVLRYRKLSSLTLVAVPCCGIIVSASVLVFLNVPLNLFHTMAMFLVVGLGMDYMIFVREIQDNPAQTLRAIVLSAATSLLSFGLLGISQLPIVSAFGLAILIANIVNLAGSFILASNNLHHSQSTQ